MKFVLILLVIMIHANFTPLLSSPTAASTAFNQGFGIFRSIVLSNAVPVFFLLSGFLFYGVRSDGYKQKLKRRVKTLLVPYILWNTLALLLLLVKKTPLFCRFFPSYQNFDLTLPNIFVGYFVMPPLGFPYDYVLWFIRNLLIVLCLSPLIGYGIRRLRWWFIPFSLLLVELLIVGMGIDDRYMLSMSILMFSAGGVLAVSTARRWWNYIAIVLFVISETILLFAPAYWMMIILDLIKYTSFGIIALQIFERLANRGWTISRQLTDSTFFIYAFHGLFVTVCCHMVCSWIEPQSIMFCIVNYILCCLLLFGISYLAYITLRRLWPRLLSLLSGSRS